ncbi:CG14204, partial [Drosophila busckii]
KVKLLVQVLLLSGVAIAFAQPEQTQSSQLDTLEFQQLMQLRHLAVEFFDYHQDFSLVNASTAAETKCLSELALLGQGLKARSMWALQMIDSWGHLPSGILYGSIRGLGNYEECIRINHEMSGGEELLGKFCFAFFDTSKYMGAGFAEFGNADLRTAVCFPNGCSGTFMAQLLRDVIQKAANITISPSFITINDGYCHTSVNPPLDGFAIFVIVFLSVLAGIVLLCTLWDYFLCEDQKKLPRLVKIWSLRANSRDLFRIVDSKSNPNVIDCLHGLRCMSLIWVIIGHAYIVSIRGPNINLVDIPTWIESAFSMLIKHATFAVDTFLFISGLLVSMISMRLIVKAKGKLNFPMMYLHRYLRLTPVLGVAIMVYMKILPIIGNGPLYDGVIPSVVQDCQKYWYWTLVYMQNYAVTDMCLQHTWYLAADMQLYIISPIFIFGLYFWGRKAVAAIVTFMLLLVACFITTMVINKYTLVLLQNGRQLYQPTHLHASPWIVGLLFGYYLHRTVGKTYNLSKLTVWIGWIICLGLIFTCIFALYPYSAYNMNLPTINEAFYISLNRIAWPLALCWVVFACKYGYGGMANSFLSSYMWMPLSKLSYSAYIWHMFMEYYNASVIRTDRFFCNYQVFVSFWAIFGFTVLMSYLLYMIVEAPFGGLQMWLLPSRPS